LFLWFGYGNFSLGNKMKNKKSKMKKPRNWLAVHAHFKTGAGKHKSKKMYTRKKKHKGKKYDT